ncbi:AcvB/VirJ family lysyl-phosphatidylglycerol hydrolase [Longimicrobium sp.]|uniref:AcvB/VirJ family lysyl-phosphatidylglycerol hydrolase n=1 Tax=Longimicrobium sp. TaxID=2029185 RepID=UPI002E343F5E|nr:AcvB/VirJ family lysyl-phosphatidylglycerol hydrolase [Longimicrobium sp.]HEX6041322.1 AcvB/VirJ family lysyl-phosphatidylglycerol hydrolase [Longimicrobium sp.]
MLVTAALLTGAAACSHVRIPENAGMENGRMRSLPLRPLPAPADSAGRAFAIVLTGDGPTGGLGKQIARDLSQAGVPSVIWSSLRYYWTPRTPEQAARDLDAVIRHYAAEWGRDRVVLVGYSMGADVMPFLVNRLPADTRARIGGVALVALAHDAVFEFRVEQWWGTSSAPRRATRPEVERLGDLPVLCVWARGDELAACRQFGTAPVRVIGLTGGHHFKGDRPRLLRVIRDLALQANGSAAR